MYLLLYYYIIIIYLLLLLFIIILLYYHYLFIIILLYYHYLFIIIIYVVTDNSTGPITARFVTNEKDVARGFNINYRMNPCLINGKK